MDIALAIDTSQDGAGGEIGDVKQFVNSIIRPLSTSENSMRLSLMTFGQTTQTLATFRDRFPESVIQEKVSAIVPSGENGRDLNVAFQDIRKNLYSLEGGMRQGHPRVVIFIVGGDAPNNFVDAANAIKSMDGMRVIAVGTKQAASDNLLAAIASERGLVFKANSPAELSSLKNRIMSSFCQRKYYFYNDCIAQSHFTLLLL